MRIADIGGTERYWKILPSDFCCGMRSGHADQPCMHQPPQASATFTYVQGNGCDLVDHPTGSLTSRIPFRHRARRRLEHMPVLPRGSPYRTALFVQTPNSGFRRAACMTPLFHGCRARRVWPSSAAFHGKLGPPAHSGRGCPHGGERARADRKMFGGIVSRCRDRARTLGLSSNRLSRFRTEGADGQWYSTASARRIQTAKLGKHDWRRQQRSWRCALRVPRPIQLQNVARLRSADFSRRKGTTLRWHRCARTP